MSSLYNTIGIDYANLRRADERIAVQVEAALADAITVINVGAGAGSYEPSDRQVTAVEPASEMIQQRKADAAPVVQASAEALPFADNSFDAAMAILTIHHWKNQAQGVSEMRRVAKSKVVFLTFDASFRGLWMTDYWPELVALDEGQMPSLSEFEQWLGPIQVDPVMVPHDCSDGFLAAYWRRPTAYLDARVRAGISAFWALEDVEHGVHKLSADLASGAWSERYRHLLDLPTLDCGYRLVSTA